jgi:hypothetical protein
MLMASFWNVGSLNSRNSAVLRDADGLLVEDLLEPADAPEDDQVIRLHRLLSFGLSASR